MTQQKTRLIGATAIAAIAIAGSLVAWQASSQGAADPAQLSDQEKLDILNSGDADAIAELLEAEEAAAQAQFARERLERQKRKAEIEVERAEAEARGAAYWDSLDVDGIDLTGFDFSLLALSKWSERDAKVADLPLVAGFDRAAEVTRPRSKFDCNPSRYSQIDQFLDREADLPLPADSHDVARALDYLAERAALQTGDCSCASQTVPIEKGWHLLARLANHPSREALSGRFAKDGAMNDMGVLLRGALEVEARSFCERG